MFSLGFFGSHNSNIVIAENDIVLEVVELERFISKKNAAFYFYYMVNNPIQILHEIKLYFEKKYGVTEYDVVVHNSVANNAETIFPAKRYVWLSHHFAHAYSGFYQSSYESALVVSFDGGSDEGFFNVYLANRTRGIEKIYTGNRDYAVPYMVLAHHLSDIKHEQLHWGNLVYAGKLMGYAGYGVVDNNYIKPFMDLYNAGDAGNIDKTYDSFRKIFNIAADTKLSGQIAQNMAATNQYVFEMLFEEELSPLLFKYSKLPIILVGGCALNVINNTRLANYREVFVPPNPNDCGLGIGLVSSEIKPLHPIDATYLGQEVWDRPELAKILYENQGVDLDIQTLANYILSGNIVGVVRGTCEHGPRALGNRSIICNPSIDNMKDILNRKVKGREWYRPFAPVVRLEDVNKYFEWNRESRWMSFCPVVREEWRNRLKAVTHVDNTSRVQTVTREQNQFLYNLLTHVNELTGMGVLVNTSFNVDGKPILNTYKEALWVLNNKQLDALVLENYFIQKGNGL
jgi:carbamoyltransferase